MLPDEDANYLMGLDISSNGRYVCGATGTGGMFIADLTTGTTQVVAGESIEARGVSDDGVAVGFNPNAVTFDISGTQTEIEPGTTGSMAEDITPDGSLIVGYSDFDGVYPHACVYKNGVKTMLPEPTDKWLGFVDNGTQAKYVSDDGSVIVGWLYDDYSTMPAIAWRQNKDGSYSADPIMRGLFEAGDGDNPYRIFEATGLSGNGRYVALVLLLPYEWEYTIGRYDLDTDELEVYGKDGDITGDLCACGIADDGTMVGYVNGMDGMYGRVGFIWKGGEAAPQYLSTLYPKAGFAGFESGAASSNSPIKITADGRYIVGFGIGGSGIQTYVFDTQSYSDDYVPPTGISNTVAGNGDSNEITDVFSINGVKLHTPMTGVNIVRRGDGTTKKIIVK